MAISLKKTRITNHSENAGSTTAIARLVIEELSLSFGGHNILQDLSLILYSGELVLLRGENGSGKTTLLNLISGYVKPDRGRIRLTRSDKKVDVIASSPDKIARLGLGRLWQDIRLFPTMTVLENVMAASIDGKGQNPLLAIAAWPWIFRQERNILTRAMENLRLVGMDNRAKSSCDMLSIGQMKRVAIARLLQMEAEILLLDEPLSGLDTTSTSTLVNDLDRLRTEYNKTIFVVEHRYKWMQNIADRVFFLRNGQIVEENA